MRALVWQHSVQKRNLSYRNFTVKETARRELEFNFQSSAKGNGIKCRFVVDGAGLVCDCERNGVGVFESPFPRSST
jgi:hypothetical protein